MYYAAKISVYNYNRLKNTVSRTLLCDDASDSECSVNSLICIKMSRMNHGPRGKWRVSRPISHRFACHAHLQSFKSNLGPGGGEISVFVAVEVGIAHLVNKYNRKSVVSDCLYPTGGW